MSAAVVHLAERRGLPAPAAPAEIPPVDRILRIKTVVDRVGLSRATIYRRMGKGEFPEQADLGGISVGWRESEINAWIASRGKGGAS